MAKPQQAAKNGSNNMQEKSGVLSDGTTEPAPSAQQVPPSPRFDPKDEEDMQNIMKEVETAAPPTDPAPTLNIDSTEPETGLKSPNATRGPHGLQLEEAPDVVYALQAQQVQHEEKLQKMLTEQYQQILSVVGVSDASQARGTPNVEELLLTHEKRFLEEMKKMISKELADHKPEIHGFGKAMSGERHFHRDRDAVGSPMGFKRGPSLTISTKGLSLENQLGGHAVSKKALASHMLSRSLKTSDIPKKKFAKSNTVDIAAGQGRSTTGNAPAKLFLGGKVPRVPSPDSSMHTGGPSMQLPSIAPSNPEIQDAEGDTTALSNDKDSVIIRRPPSGTQGQPEKELSPRQKELSPRHSEVQEEITSDEEVVTQKSAKFDDSKRESVEYKRSESIFSKSSVARHTMMRKTRDTRAALAQFAEEAQTRHMFLPTIKRIIRSIRETNMQQLVRSRPFELTVAFVIMFNAAVIGIQADWDIKNIGDERPETFRHLDLFFAVAFTTELSMRIHVERCFFTSSKNENFKWNVFDSILVASSIFEEVFMLAADSEGATVDISTMRTLRIMRLVRILRIVRMARVFRDLRKMVTGILTSLKSLFWCMLLLVTIMFTFGVCLMQVATEEMTKIHDTGVSGNIDEGELIEYYGSLVRTVFTLYMTICGGVDWYDVTEPLISIHPAMGALFAVYIAFAVFCVLNIVTGVFVENATKITQQGDTTAIMDELGIREMWLTEVQHLFRKNDADDSGELDWEEFENCLSEERIQEYFKILGINLDRENIFALFQLLDFDGDGTVDMEEFVEGCTHVHGQARSLDIVRLRHENKLLARNIAEVAELCRVCFSVLMGEHGISEHTIDEAVGDPWMDGSNPLTRSLQKNQRKETSSVIKLSTIRASQAKDTPALEDQKSPEDDGKSSRKTVKQTLIKSQGSFIGANDGDTKDPVLPIVSRIPGAVNDHDIISEGSENDVSV